MKPELKTEIVEVQYWDCGNPDHRHKTERVATLCMRTEQRRLDTQANIKNWSHKRYMTLLAAHHAGANECELAKFFGISEQQASLALQEAQRRENYIPSSMDGLSVRTRNCLRAENLSTVDEIREAFNKGVLEKTPNFGAVSRRELEYWLFELGRTA